MGQAAVSMVPWKDTGQVKDTSGLEEQRHQLLGQAPSAFKLPSACLCPLEIVS